MSEKIIIGNAELWHGDCREILPGLAKHDLLLTDPPYGIFKGVKASGVMFGKETIYCEDRSTAEWDLRPSAEILAACISAAQKWIIWGGNYLAGELGACKGPLEASDAAN